MAVTAMISGWIATQLKWKADRAKEQIWMVNSISSLGAINRWELRPANERNRLPIGLRIFGDRYSVIEVQRTIGADGCRRPHRSDQHDRFLTLHDHIEEERRFFHRVGSVSDDDAVDVWLREQFVDPLGELQHDVE